YLSPNAPEMYGLCDQNGIASTSIAHGAWKLCCGRERLESATKPCYKTKSVASKKANHINVCEASAQFPFTRSNRFSDLHCERYLLPAKQAEHFRQSFPGLFATLLPNSVSQPRRVSKFRSSNRVSRYASAVPCPAFDQNLVVIGILFLFVEQLFKQVIDERGVE